MAILNRASLPEEFFDVTSGRMLLAPEPQYPFAWLLKAALGNALMASMPGFAGVNAARGIPGAGAAATPWQAMARLGMATVDAASAQAFIVVPELGKSPGHTVRINRPRYGSGGFTLASREITSGSSISQVGIDIGSEQVTVTLKRYGGPYDSTQSAVAPFVIDKFDSTVALHSLVDYVALHLQRDLDRLLDTAMAAFLASGSTTLWPQAFTADNQSQAVGDLPMDIDMMFRGVETLKNANIPTFADGSYRAFISPTQKRQIMGDPQAAGFTVFDINGQNPVTSGSSIENSFVAKIPGCKIYEATTLPTSVNAQSVTVTTGVMFGPGMVACGMGALPYVVAANEDNYGEHAKVVHLHYAGYNLADNRFAVQLHTS